MLQKPTRVETKKSVTEGVVRDVKGAAAENVRYLRS
jgi:hypothetical protein